MSGIRQAPYGAFNFIVDLGTGSSEGPDAGFEECGPFAERVDVIEYRNGNDATNEPRKITGLSTVQDISFKRGVIGSQTLYDWFDEVRSGQRLGAAQHRGDVAQRGPLNPGHDLEAVACAPGALSRRPAAWPQQ